MGGLGIGAGAPVWADAIVDLESAALYGHLDTVPLRHAHPSRVGPAVGRLDRSLGVGPVLGGKGRPVAELSSAQRTALIPGGRPWVSSEPHPLPATLFGLGFRQAGGHFGLPGGKAGASARAPDPAPADTPRTELFSLCGGPPLHLTAQDPNSAVWALRRDAPGALRPCFSGQASRVAGRRWVTGPLAASRRARGGMATRPTGGAGKRACSGDGQGADPGLSPGLSRLALPAPPSSVGVLPAQGSTRLCPNRSRLTAAVLATVAS